MKTNIDKTTAQIKAANLEEKGLLCAKLRHLLDPLGILPEALDIRVLRSADAIFVTLETMINEKERYLKKIKRLKFTIESIAKKAGLCRETIQRNRTLLAIIRYYSPEETKITAFDELVKENESLKTLLAEKIRKERTGEDFEAKVRISSLEGENEELKRQAAVEEKARKSLEDRILELEAENRKLKDVLNYMNPAVLAQFDPYTPITSEQS